MSHPLPFPVYAAPARVRRRGHVLLALLLAPFGLLVWWLTICLVAVASPVIAPAAFAALVLLGVVRPRRGPARRRAAVAPRRPAPRTARPRPPVRRVRAR